jgi:4-hydroxybenzoate polyprenyltransferase
MAAVTRAFITSVSFGMFAVVLAFFGIFYNLEPIRSTKYLWVNIVWQAVSRGLLLYPAAFAAFGEPMSTVGWGMGVVAFLLVLSMQQTADFSDVEMDEKHGIITPAVHYGLEKLVYIMTGIVLLMFSVLTLFIEYSIVPNFWSLYLLFIPIGWSLWSLYTEPGETNDLSDNHSSWYVYYGCLASMYMLPAVQLTLF